MAARDTLNLQTNRKESVRVKSEMPESGSIGKMQGLPASEMCSSVDAPTNQGIVHSRMLSVFLAES